MLAALSPTSARLQAGSHVGILSFGLRLAKWLEVKRIQVKKSFLSPSF